MKYLNFLRLNNIIISILVLIIGVVLYSRPDLFEILLSYILGGALVLYGIIRTGILGYQKGKDGKLSIKFLLLTIFIILLGAFCIFFLSAVKEVIRYFIGGLILIIGINRIIQTINFVPTKTKKFILLVVVDLLLCALGIFTIFYGTMAIKYYGIILIIYAAFDIINYIFTFKTTKINVDNSESVQLIETKEK